MTATITSAYGTLDVTDDWQVTEYERHFYRAYAGLADNKLVRLIWEWDDTRQRVRTRIGYSDQVIYSARDSRGRLAAAMAVNLRYPAEFQAAAFGFPRAGGAKGRYCEILNVFTTSHHGETARTTYGSFIRGFGYVDLAAHGFEAAYATCTRRRLRSCQRLGAQVLAETSIDGEARYFLQWSLRDPTGTVGHPAAGKHHDHENLFYEVRNSFYTATKLS
jgi:hypothetical protein